MYVPGVTSSFQEMASFPSSSRYTAPAFPQALVGDFTGSGFQQVFLLYTEADQRDVPTKVYGRVLAAADPKNLGLGLRLGASPTSLPERLTLFQPPPLAVGDFIGDGRKQIAYLLADGQTVNFYAVDPDTLALDLVTTAKIPQSVPSGAVLTAGRFRVPDHDDLVVIGPMGEKQDMAAVQAIATARQRMATHSRQRRWAIRRPLWQRAGAGSSACELRLVHSWGLDPRLTS